MLLVPHCIREGKLHDNAPMESFYKILKCKLVDDAKSENSEGVKQAIFKYIEMFYNTKRMH